NAHQQVLTEPPPGAVLDNFGANSLEFFMWFFVADVGRGGGVQSDLRIAIMKEFKAAGIEIPVHQHDLHLRDLDGVRALLNRIAEERAPKPPPPPPNSAQPRERGAGDFEEINDERAPSASPTD